MTKKAADLVYKQTGLTPNDVQVIEVHDCFASNELFVCKFLIFFFFFLEKQIQNKNNLIFFFC